ncbi:MAG TPA: carboxypeptidase-like regulatory domain-containing protein [Acidimicrobiia bacterium]|nr:carboxypeptidase-like regulatory domain-containing protein [Acidimicrobiia bacterium]
MRPTGSPAGRRRAVVVLAGFAVLAGLAGCSKDDGKALPDPRPSSTSTTTELVDYTQVSLPAVNPGKSPPITKPPGPGQASIAGRVVDSDGAPVPAAFIRATYYGNPDKPEVIDAVAGPDGAYEFKQVFGGRWRLRAWLPPTLSSLEVAAFFLGAKEQNKLDLKVKAVADVAVTSSMAPNPPFLGSPAELAVRVVTQSVDPEGRVVRTAATGVPIALSVLGSWSLQSPAFQGTDTDGTARWTMVCGAEGTQQVSAVTFEREFPLSVPSCLDPASTTTTSTTAPGSSTSSTRPKAKVTTTTRPKSTSTTRPAIQAR